jgi:hypothetical protein
LIDKERLKEVSKFRFKGNKPAPTSSGEKPTGEGVAKGEAPIVFSSATGFGLSELLDALWQKLSEDKKEETDEDT